MNAATSTQTHNCTHINHSDTFLNKFKTLTTIIFKSAVLMFLPFTLHAQMFGGIPGFGGGIDPDHIPKNPFQKDYIRVSKCELKANNKVYQLNEGNNKLQDILEILALTPTGKKLVEDFQQQETKTPHKFIELNTYVRQQNNFPVKIGAAYVFDETGRYIYYDPQDDLGLLAVFLSHEFMHSIDEEVPPAYFAEVDAFKRSKEEFIKLHQVNSFRIERRAFNMQDKVLPELLTLAPCYESFLQEHRNRNGLKLFLPTPDSYIRSAYDIPEKRIENLIQTYSIDLNPNQLD